MAIICPQCNGLAEYKQYLQRYQCLQRECGYNRDIHDLTDEEKIYFNRQEGFKKFPLANPVKEMKIDDCGNIEVEWLDGSSQKIIREQLFAVLLKEIYNKDIRLPDFL